MNNKRKSDLENFNNWDTGRIEVRQPSKPSRVVFSVAFKRDDFERISHYAELNGKKTSEFIREAAIEKTMTQDNYASATFIGGSQHASWLFNTTEMPSITALYGFPEGSTEPIQTS